MKKVIAILWYLSIALLIPFGLFGAIYALLPNPSIIPDTISHPLFYAQFPIISLFIITSVLKDKCN